MAHPHAEHRAHHVARANKMIHRAGYARGGSVHDDAKEDGRMIERGVHEHEASLHKGSPKTKLHLGDGVEGEKARHHLAKRARGGATGKKHGSTKVNVIVAPQGGGAAPGMHPALPIAPPARPAMPPPAAAPMGAPPGMPPRPPMAAPPGGGMMPPGAGMMRKRGGKIGKRRASGGEAGDDFPPNPHNLLKWQPDPGRKSIGLMDDEAPLPDTLRKNLPPQPMNTRLGRAKGGRMPHEEAGAMSGIGRIDKIHEYGSGRGFKPKKIPMAARGR